MAVRAIVEVSALPDEIRCRIGLDRSAPCAGPAAVYHVHAGDQPMTMVVTTWHDQDCSDPTEIAGPHAACPCAWCMDTGYIGADADDAECDCSAVLQPEEEAHAEINRLGRLGSLNPGGRFQAHPR